MRRSEVRLRHPPESVYASPAPASEELKQFLKQHRVERSLRSYLTDFVEVTDVRQLVERRDDIMESANCRARKFSTNDLTQLLDAAQQWQAARASRASESGIYDPGVTSKLEKKRWRNSLKSADAGSQLIRFLERRGVHSRSDLLARGDELIEAHKTKVRRFALKELEDLLDDFQNSPLQPCSPLSRVMIPESPQQNAESLHQEPPSMRPADQSGLVNVCGQGNQVALTIT